MKMTEVRAEARVLVLVLYTVTLLETFPRNLTNCNSAIQDAAEQCGRA